MTTTTSKSRAEHEGGRGALVHLAVAVLADRQAGSGYAGATVPPNVAVHADAQVWDATREQDRPSAPW
jgi:hypothetical protein